MSVAGVLAQLQQLLPKGWSPLDARRCNFHGLPLFPSNRCVCLPTWSTNPDCSRPIPDFQSLESYVRRWSVAEQWLERSPLATLGLAQTSTLDLILFLSVTFYILSWVPVVRTTVQRLCVLSVGSFSFPAGLIAILFSPFYHRRFLHLTWTVYGTYAILAPLYAQLGGVRFDLFLVAVASTLAVTKLTLDSVLNARQQPYFGMHYILLTALITEIMLRDGFNMGAPGRNVLQELFRMFFQQLFMEQLFAQQWNLSLNVTSMLIPFLYFYVEKMQL